MKRINASGIKTGIFFDLPNVPYYLVELNGQPRAVLISVPRTLQDVEKITSDLTALVKEQEAKPE